MKKFLVYESNYGNLANEVGATNIVGVYNTRTEAQQVMDERVEKGFEEGFVKDFEANGKSGLDMILMFLACNGNWQDYYEIRIKEVEV